MKKIVSLLIATLMALPTVAAPARGGWTYMTLADGSVVKVRLVGDEFCHYYVTEDGTPVGEVPQRQSPAALSLRRAAKRGQSQSPISTPGKKKQLVILMEFTDKTFLGDDAYDHWNGALNTGNVSGVKTYGSLRQYFLDQSRGIFDVDFDIYGPFTAQHEYAYYGKNDRSGFDIVPGDLVVEGLKAIEGQANLKDYDWDGDGEVEQVVVIYAGRGENDSSVNDANLIWPHQYYLEYATTDSKAYHHDGITVSTYCILNHEFRNDIDGIGTFAHEYSHCLGQPDYYQTSGSTHGKDNFGEYDLMHTGCYNGDSWCPANYTAFEKYTLGWYEPLQLTDALTVTDLKPMSDGGDAYYIDNDGNSNEFFVLENRMKSGWDTFIPGEGLLITHYDYDDMAWNSNEVNNTATHQRAVIVPANNSSKNTSGYPYPYITKGIGGTYTVRNNEFTDDSSPASVVFNANTDGVKKLHKPVTNITRNDEGLISFDFMGGTADIHTIGIDPTEAGPREYYDLMGRRVTSPVSGSLYIIRYKNSHKTYKSSFK